MHLTSSGVSRRLRPLVAAFLASMCLPTLAANVYLEDPISGCKIWTDKIDPSGEVVSWDGACVGGLANGNGTLSWFRDNGLLGRYRGTMAFGKLHGQGVLDYQAKGGYNRFAGDFVDGELLGKLVYDGANGDHFEGVVRDDGHKGQGVFVDANGEWYDGDFKDGLYHGKGLLLLKDGGQLEGHFVVGKAEGQGTYTAVDGTLYEAVFIKGQIDGKVLVTHNDGSTEEQLWKMDQPVSDHSSEEKQP